MTRHTFKGNRNYDRRYDEEYGSDVSHGSQHSNSRTTNVRTENMIADMAKGFVEAQAKITDGSRTDHEEKILQALSEISSQLQGMQQQMKGSVPKGNKTGDQSAGGGGEQDNSQGMQAPDSTNSTDQMNNSTNNSNNNNAIAEELKSVFSTLLQGTGQQTMNNNPSQAPDKQKSADSNPSMKNMTQIISQAQYELANELETSLNKLKQVIRESERVANKISNLLGKEKQQ
ncbi:Hypothetical protein LUCI_3246 [Lucifera butyrica]|uniref:Uncharacterized protein n=1 Tax=Lucifera butyrica TaxID=1351585 RepID=A0A498R9C3_9FIRM|nr:hypothetical protein [Lucifera butyrica]VBB07981.1 Hypothetical protein LUCI_3246 [Lucifera butyrica]